MSPERGRCFIFVPPVRAAGVRASAALNPVDVTLRGMWILSANHGQGADCANRPEIARGVS